MCACGHSWEAHLHYRAGSDCSLCETCSRFRLAPGQPDGLDQIGQAIRHVRAEADNAEAALIQAARDDGWTFARIGRALGSTAETVRYRAGLKHR
jgi:hypothetical protein